MMKTALPARLGVYTVISEELAPGKNFRVQSISRDTEPEARALFERFVTGGKATRVELIDPERNTLEVWDPGANRDVPQV